jgi:hypothetical protein
MPLEKDVSTLMGDPIGYFDQSLKKMHSIPAASSIRCPARSSRVLPRRALASVGTARTPGA